jgi:hypothetical protein
MMRQVGYAISRKQIRTAVKRWALRHLENLDTDGRTARNTAYIKKMRH